MRDDLIKPLGLKPTRPANTRNLYLAGAAGVAVVAVAALATGLWLWKPAVKGPTAVAVINAPEKATITPAPEVTGSTAAAAPSGLTEMEPSGGLNELNQVIIHDPSQGPVVELASLPEKDLVEKTDQGPLPKMSTNGIRPLDAYARPTEGSATDTRVAIIIGGLGIDPAGTKDAITTLPGEVTFAFAPYGEKLTADAAAARVAGHELLLQIPLEPFNYPKTDPGQNTLTVSATPDENRTRLHWLLSRMTNYVGVMNYMGGRFTSDVGPLTPVMQEIGQRGLMYLDDGTSTRSRAAEVASANTPFLRADIVLDADLSAEAIDDRLNQLRAIARERGYAVATATAFPITIQRVAAFAKTAADKGITLVPVSAIVPRT